MTPPLSYIEKLLNIFDDEVANISKTWPQKNDSNQEMNESFTKNDSKNSGTNGLDHGRCPLLLRSLEDTATRFTAGVGGIKTTAWQTIFI